MKKMLFLAAFAAVASASTVVAQAPGGRGRGPGGRGDPGMMLDRALLRGITLTDAQQAQLKALRDADREKIEAERGNGRAEFEAIREARQKGDTVTANKLMAEQRAKMEARRDAEVSAIRALLTGDQVATFDANVAEMKARQAEGGPRGRGPRPPQD